MPDVISLERQVNTLIGTVNRGMRRVPLVAKSTWTTHILDSQRFLVCCVFLVGAVLSQVIRRSNSTPAAIMLALFVYVRFFVEQWLVGKAIRTCIMNVISRLLIAVSTAHASFVASRQRQTA